MKRFVVASAVLALTAAFPAGAGASTKWVCDVPGVGTVTFVTAADAARHGIETANSKAGVVFNLQFGGLPRRVMPLREARSTSYVRATRSTVARTGGSSRA